LRKDTTWLTVVVAAVQLRFETWAPFCTVMVPREAAVPAKPALPIDCVSDRPGATAGTLVTLPA
jgi:hypothetical protein